MLSKQLLVKVLRLQRQLVINLILRFQVSSNLKAKISKRLDKERAKLLEKKDLNVRERRELSPIMLYLDGIDLLK